LFHNITSFIYFTAISYFPAGCRYQRFVPGREIIAINPLLRVGPVLLYHWRLTSRQIHPSVKNRGYIIVKTVIFDQPSGLVCEKGNILPFSDI
jgi:hypothetical protein